MPRKFDVVAFRTVGFETSDTTHEPESGGAWTPPSLA